MANKALIQWFDNLRHHENSIRSKLPWWIWINFHSSVHKLILKNKRKEPHLHQEGQIEGQPYSNLLCHPWPRDLPTMIQWGITKAHKNENCETKDCTYLSDIQLNIGNLTHWAWVASCLPAGSFASSEAMWAASWHWSCHPAAQWYSSC